MNELNFPKTIVHHQLTIISRNYFVNPIENDLLKDIEQFCRDEVNNAYKMNSIWECLKKISISLSLINQFLDHRLISRCLPSATTKSIGSAYICKTCQHVAKRYRWRLSKFLDILNWKSVLTHSRCSWLKREIKVSRVLIFFPLLLYLPLY